MGAAPKPPLDRAVLGPLGQRPGWAHHALIGRRSSQLTGPGSSGSPGSRGAPSRGSEAAHQSPPAQPGGGIPLVNLSRAFSERAAEPLRWSPSWLTRNAARPLPVPLPTPTLAHTTQGRSRGVQSGVSCRGCCAGGEGLVGERRAGARRVPLAGAGAAGRPRRRARRAREGCRRWLPEMAAGSTSGPMAAAQAGPRAP